MMYCRMKIQRYKVNISQAHLARNKNLLLSGAIKVNGGRSAIGTAALPAKRASVQRARLPQGGAAARQKVLLQDFYFSHKWELFHIPVDRVDDADDGQNENADADQTEADVQNGADKPKKNEN